jgi:fructokinase
LAYLNERNDADYTFYKDYPNARLDVEWPEVNKDDIVMMGSYFVLNPILRNKVKEFLDYASKQEALIYYDINFRSSHASEAIKLRSSILENFEYASIVRGSTEDFQNMFKISDPEKAYEQEVKFHCKQMLCTDAEGDICLFSPNVTKTYQVHKIETVSTIGAGDNFNAGIVFGLLKEGIGRDDVATITEAQWNRIIAHGMAFAAEVCQSLNNSISKDFAKNYGRNEGK